MSVAEKMTAIADKIRGLLGIEELLTLDDMPDKIGEVDEQAWSDGFEHGYNDGETYGREQGVQAEYDRFWDAFQKNGAAKNYHHAFSYGKFTKENYNPKYDIVASNGTTTSQYMFYDAGDIEDTKVAVALNRNAQYAFGNCYNLKIIRKLTVLESTVLTNTFQNCTSLSDITVDGVIGQSINMQWCPLTPESAWNVVQHLKCFEAYPDPEGDINPDFMKYTVTFSSAVWAALDEYTRENELHGWGTVKDYIENVIGWKTA